MTQADNRMAPLHCPYCGDEELVPREEPAGAWKCAACLRVFTVQLVGLALPDHEHFRQEGAQDS